MPKPADLFAAMPAQFNAERAAGVDASVLFDLSGEGGGQWLVTVRDGQVAVDEGGGDASATVHMTAEDYADMVTGKLNPMQAFMTGKVKVEGDLAAVMKFQTLFM